MIISRNKIIVLFLLSLILVISSSGWKTSNQNSQWQKLNEYHVRDIILFKGELIICSKQGIFSLNEKLNSNAAYCLATDGNILVAGIAGGLLVYDSTWRKIEIIQNGFPAQVRTIKNYNRLFFLGHTQGSYGVTTWHPEKGVLYEHDFHAYIRSIEIHNSTIYAGDEDGIVWISTNMGQSFDSTVHLDNYNLAVRSIKWINDSQYIAAGWIFKDYKRTDHYITPVDFYMNFVLSGDQGIFRFDEEMNTLTPFNEGLDDLRVSKLLLYKGDYYVGTVTGLYKRSAIEYSLK